MLQAQWAVVGAGPAGISSVGTLLDEGIEPGAIVWIDPAFVVGDFGSLWGNVPSNTQVGDFYKMFDACRSFEFGQRSSTIALDGFAKDTWCDLRYVSEPLQAITAGLRAKVVSVVGFVTRCNSIREGWLLQLRDGPDLHAKNVVLAVGARARALDLRDQPVIPLEIALDRERLPSACTRGDTVAVFGSSHSAVLAMRILLENCDVAGVVNFYRSPLRYAVLLSDGRWLYYDTGLKGTTAAWARTNLGSNCVPQRLTRFYADAPEYSSQLARCTKAVCAIGFQPRPEPVVDGMTALKYDTRTGIIAPGLFGCGFAFPEIAADEFGETAQRVGLIRFARHIARVVPLWRSYSAGTR